jgi:hypothetical protein
MKSNRTPNFLWFHHWIKIQRKYRNTQAKWLESHDIRIARKLDILKRKIHGLNRKWRLGFASAVLTTWLTAFPSAQVEAQSFPQDLDLSALDGSDGFALSGLDPYDRVGTSVSNAGDVNGDGIDDFIIGSRNAFVYGIGPNVGRAYVVFGGVGLTDPNFDLSSLDGTNGFVINGTAYADYLGSAVSGAGDVNGDGVDDLIIGAPGVDTSYDDGSEVFDYTNAGAIYVIFGKPSGSTFSASLDLSTLDGSNGFEVYSTDSNGGAGTSVSGAGDINGDGVDDLLIGAPGVNGFDVYAGPFSDAGAAYVVFGKSSGSSFPASLDLSGLDGSNGFAIIGGNEYGYAGTSVSDAGDVNEDGIDDLLIGAPGTNDYYDNSGSAYVVFGKTDAFASSLDLAGLDGSNGFVINGYYENQYLGTSVSGAGDINGDGIDDLIIGSPYDGSFSRGVSYVIFGQMDEFSSSINAYDVNGTNGFAIVGSPGDLAGSAVSGVGDVNGDGIDDLLIGAPGADSYDYNNVGSSYVVFGKTSSFSNYMNVNDLDGYVNGFVINGYDENESSGFSVSGAGDINGDGVTDLLIGAPSQIGESMPGTAYVVFGIVVPIVPVLINAITDQKAKEDQAFSFEIPDNTFVNVETLSVSLTGGGALPEWLSFEPTTSTFSGTPANGDVGTLSIEVTGTDSESNTATDTFDLIVQDAQSFPSTVDLSSLDGSDGFVMKGIDATDVSGYEVSGVGDINGDGFDDVLIGAKLADPNGNNYAGEVYIVFGKADGFTSSIGLSDLDGTNGFLIEGLDAGDRIGARKSGAGDVNGDGINDLLIGSYTADANGNAGAGETYVIFGKSTAFAASFDLSGLNGSNGFIIDGVAAGDASGTEVASADINGDNVDDILIGASNASANANDNSGVTYVVYGKTTSFAANLDLSSLDGTNGFAINGIDADDYSGTSVSNAGDVNGDGIEDILIGSYSASQNGNGNTGEIYVVFGKTGSFGPSMNLSSLDGNNGFIIRGIDGGDYSGLSVSSAGDMNGDDVDDILIGGFGADIDGKSLVGETYVVFGKTTAFAASFDLSALDGTNGFTINGINDGDWSGRSVSEAGDVNLDGYDDILIGASRVDNGDDSNVGAAYVVYGKGAAFASSLDLSSLDGTNGFVIKGIDSGDNLGFSIDQAGDVNGDGVSDLLLGAYGARNDSYQGQVGETYVVFGVLSASAPTLANAIEDQAATEDAEFSFVVPANTFEDLNENDEQTLSATLDGGDPLPDWIIFDGATATFSGIPANEDVGIISVEVTNTDEDGLSTSDVFELEVTNTNDEPVLAAIGNQSGDENAEITFTASAEDIDPTEDNLTYTIDPTSVTKGMSIDGSTGAFIWTPDEDQDGDHDVTVTVTDGELFDDETFTITVNEVNQDPVLDAIGNQEGDEETAITFTATATDSDLPANDLSYFIDISSSEKGMSIDEVTGVFSWTPTPAQVGDHVVTVTVTDGDLEDEETITITVNSVVNTWNGENWSGGEAPLPGENARLSGDYQSGFYGSLEVNNLEIDPEVTLTMDGAFTLKINGDLTNSGDIIIESGSSLITYEANSITGNDIIFIRNTRYEDGKYSFVGTPIEQNASTTGASLGTSVYRYEEFIPYSTNEGLNRWAPADLDELIPATGYTQAFQKELIFVGKPNDGTVTYSGTYTEDTDDANEGWNLVSNPYPAAIFIDEFLNENLNIAGAVYIWDDNDSESVRGSNNDYIVANEIAATDNSGADNEIRYNFHLGSSQGFFVKLLSDLDTDVDFTEDMRVSGNNADGNFFRKTSENIPLVRLNLTDAEGLFKQTIIGWPSDAADDKMQRAYDAPVFNASSANSLYTHKLGKKLAIQGVSDERVTIDLGFSVDRKADYQLFVDFEQASDMSLWIHDQLTDEIIDLQKGAYHFSSEVGDFLNRFVILTENKGVLANGNLDQEGSNVYASDNVLYINPSSLDLETGVSRTYTVFNLSGKFMMKTEVNRRSQIALNAFIPGVYLVSDGAAITKIIIE